MEYLRPPIIEAVVQLVFSQALEIKEIDLFGERASKSGWSSIERKSINVNLDANTNSTSATSKKTGLEFRNDDSNRIIILENNSIILSNLAPYPGWVEFSGWILKQLSELRKIIGPAKISRTGMRFINRIDVPFDELGLAHTESFVSIHPQPFIFGGQDFIHFFVSFTKQYEKSDIYFNLQCGTSESPMPDNIALNLDIDTYIDGIGAFNIEKLKNRLDELRLIKNNLFEKIITNKTRSLLGPVK